MRAPLRGLILAALGSLVSAPLAAQELPLAGEDPAGLEPMDQVRPEGTEGLTPLDQIRDGGPVGAGADEPSQAPPGATPSEGPNPGGAPSAPAEGTPSGVGLPMGASDGVGLPTGANAVVAFAGGRPFLVVLADLDNAFTGQVLTASLCGSGGARVELRDDGAQPDVAGADGMFHGVGVSCVGGDTDLLLLGPDGERLGETSFSLDGLESPSVRMTLQGDELEVKVASDGPSADGVDGAPISAAPTAAGSAGAVGTLGAPPPDVGGDPLSKKLPSLEAPEGAGGALALAGLGAGLLLGGGAVFWLRRRRPIALERAAALPALSMPAGLTASGDGPTLWTVPDEALQRAAVIALARRLSRTGAVVVLARPGGREAIREGLGGAPGIFWPTTDRADIDKIQAICDHLSIPGPVFVVVEGAGALEPPAAEEEPGAVIEELVEELKVPSWLILREDEPRPMEPAAALTEALVRQLGASEG